ncbi:Predicted ATPase [Bradyrhizobium erythrophlei]|uniref:Predicted ATPase n=2 Tax=Bradyrhizobium erythrophlei TaxID=1437360 RepID=A0A1M7TKW1_9BRAD|nr:Predicted ATPase [Bradyrhizobium erythrophlei]
MLRRNDRPAPEVVHVGAFKLFPSQRLLMRDTEVVKLGGRSFDILLALADRPGEVVTQKELIAKVWPDVFVENVSLRVHVAALRKALDCDGTRCLATVPGRGYCLVAPIVRETIEELPESVPAIEPAYPLPPPLARMVGRDEDVRAICEELLARRFVTVVGAGGVGKTTTVLSAAHELLDEFLGAVCLVELSPVNSPQFLASAITSAFRLPVRAQDPIPELATHLRGKRVLLVLDSCEHLIAEAARVAERLFREASDLYILATSREALRVEGEHIYPLPPLISPPEDEKLTAAEALAYPAVQLFVNRIVSAGFSKGLVDEDARIVSGMCRQLGGIALAIELAAGRVAAYGIRDTASLLNGQFALLWPGRRTAPPRQQTLNATLDWSYDLLSDDERRVFRQLSVFTGGFTLDAACGVVTGDGPGSLEFHRIVASLVAKSLASADPGASKRYRLLDMTRTYAGSKLQQAGESLDLCRRHATYYRDLLAQAARENQDPRALAAEIENIRAALSWSFKPSGDSELGVQLAALSATTWLGLGLLTECHDWMRTAYQLLDDTPAPLPQHLGICMALASTLLFTASDIGEFKPVWNKAFGLAVSLGDVESQMSCHLALWALQIRVPHYADCLAVAEDCLRTAERADNSGAIGQAEWMLGQSNLHLGRPEEAMSHYQRFITVDTEASRLAMMKQTGYDRRSDALGNLSFLWWLTGSPEQALRIGSEAVSVARSLEFPLPIAVAGMWNGLTHYFIESDIDKIEADMVDLVEHARTHGIVQFQGFGLSILGLCQARRGQLDEARRLVEEGLRLQDASHIRVFHPAIRSELAEAAANLGRLEVAESILQQNDRDDVNDPEHWWTPEILRVKSVVAEATGRMDDGVDLCRRAAALARRRGALSFELRAATTLGRMSAPHPHEALELLDSVYGRFAEGFHTPDLLKAKRLIDELKMSGDRPGLQYST